MLDQLEKLRMEALSQLEAGELVQRFLMGLETMPPAGPRTDVTIFNKFVNGLQPLSSTYAKAVIKVQGNSLTKDLVKGDEHRDKTLSTWRKAVKLAGQSEIPAEANAAHHLKVLLDNYKGVDKFNYEAETLALDKLSAELESPAYAPQVALLNLQRYAQAIKDSNQAFKAVSGNRISTESQKEIFDTRELRNQMLAMYSDMCLYVVVTASTTADPYYVQMLSLINTTRKQYADMVAQRKGVQAAKKAKA